MAQMYAVIGCVESQDPPENSLALGNQNGDIYYLAVANTEWGTIPGKARNGHCWYPYGDIEYRVESDFAYVTSFRPTTLVKSTTPPPHAILCGYQNDGSGYHYAAVAETEYGTIIGKAIGDNCWYPYGGKEYSTKDFKYAVLEQ